MKIQNYNGKNSSVKLISGQKKGPVESIINTVDSVSINAEKKVMENILKPVPENSQNVSPFQGEAKIEHDGKLVKIIQEIKPDSSIEGLNELVSKGVIHSYSQGEKELIVYADSEEALEELKKLKGSCQFNFNKGYISKLKEIFIPPDLKENCAEEYINYRMWSLSAAVCGGAIGFMTTRVNLDAMKVAFSSTENAALSGVINGMISKFTSMGGSFLAKKGDMDPKKFILASSMIASFNSLLTLGLLCSVPGVMPYLTGFTAMSGALAGSLGSAAGVNIFNHMAKGPSKGLVATKNSNQDMIADMCGMPLAMLLTRVAGVAGMNPYIFTVATLGPLLAFCTLKSASSIRMDPLHQANVEKIADNYISKNEVPVADTRGIFNTFKSLFSGDSKEYSKKINFADSFESLLGDGNKKGSKERLFSIFKDENYMVNCKGDHISILFRNKAGVDDILKGYIHARLLENALSGKMDKNLKELYGDDASTALVELSYRAMPANMRFIDELTAKGWHSGAVKIDVKKLDTSWNGQDKVLSSGIDIKKFLELSENPSGEELKKLLDYAYGSSNSEKTGEVN